MWSFGATTDLEPLVLEDLLDRNVVFAPAGACEAGLEDDTKGAISNDFAVGVRDVFLLAIAVACDDLDDLGRVVDGWGPDKGGETSRACRGGRT